MNAIKAFFARLKLPTVAQLQALFYRSVDVSKIIAGIRTEIATLAAAVEHHKTLNKAAYANAVDHAAAASKGTAAVASLTALVT